jgi:hypothetical protein
MKYSLEARINAELSYDLSYVIEPTAPSFYSIVLYEAEDGRRFMEVVVKYDTGTNKNNAFNQRQKVQRDLVKQVDKLGGYVRIHECYDDEGLPCVFEDIAGSMNAGDRSTRMRNPVVIRTWGDG